MDNICPPAQEDSAWKEMLDLYFQEFMDFFYPAFSAQIDWKEGYKMLDKELQSVLSNSGSQERYVDKLVEVQTRAEDTCFILFHVEIQGDKIPRFEERLFEYYYRLHEAHHKPIVTLVVLTDAQVAWRPERYQSAVLGEVILDFRFHVIKILDYADRAEALSQQANPFGLVVLAHLEAEKTRRDAKRRCDRKLMLTRLLYERGWDKEKILGLYKFLDWLLALPPALDIRYNNDMRQWEKEKSVSYITTAERLGIEKGLKKGLLQGLEQGRQEGEQKGEKTGRQKGEAAILTKLLVLKFHHLTEDCRGKIAKADSDTLLRWSERLLVAKTLAEVFD